MDNKRSRYKTTDHLALKELQTTGPKPTIEWIKNNPDVKPIKKTKTIKPEIINHSNEITELSNNRSVMGMIKKEASMNFPGQEDYRNQVIYTLLKWADEAEALDITAFCKLYKIPRRTFYQMYQDHADFRDLADEAKLWIGLRRREGALKRYYDKDVAFKDMYKYDPEWKEIDRYNQTLKGDSDVGQTINVYLPTIKSSNEVPALEQPTREEIKEEDATI